MSPRRFFSGARGPQLNATILRMTSAKTWSWFHRLKFILGYAWGKTRLIYDVRHPRLTFFVFEWRYSLTNLINTVRRGVRSQAMYDGPAEIETRFESFEVRPGTQDAAIISPAFERADFTHLIKLARQRGADGPVDFIDVGANIGQFSVRVPMRLPDVDLRAWACEPVPQNMALL